MQKKLLYIFKYIILIIRQMIRYIANLMQKQFLQTILCKMYLV